MVGSKRIARPGRKKIEVISLQLNIPIERRGVTG